jgi:hypothetical protein
MITLTIRESQFMLSNGTTEIPLSSDDFTLIQEGVIPARIRSALENSNVAEDELIRVARSSPLPE